MEKQVLQGFFFLKKKKRLKREVWEDESSGGLCTVYTLEITGGSPLCEDVLQSCTLAGCTV